jgi:hypothetical protein
MMPQAGLGNSTTPSQGVERGLAIRRLTPTFLAVRSRCSHHSSAPLSADGPQDGGKDESFPDVPEVDGSRSGGLLDERELEGHVRQSPSACRHEGSKDVSGLLRHALPGDGSAMGGVDSDVGQRVMKQQSHVSISLK